MTGEPTDYEWDIFLSYKRKTVTPKWLDNFKRLLEYYLGEELGRKIEIFLDTKTIDPGHIWPESLKGGVKRSRCMLGVFSAQYFKSVWCEWEAGSFLDRGRFLSSSEATLIMPVQFGDGDHYSSEISYINMIDLREWAFISDAFWESVFVLPLEKKIREMAPSLKRIILRAPPFQDFPVRDVVWQEKPPSDILLQRISSREKEE